LRLEHRYSPFRRNGSADVALTGDAEAHLSRDSRQFADLEEGSCWMR
jgi:hypothetical protein